MEPITALASIVIAIVFTGAFEALGQDLKDRLMTAIRRKFKASGTEELLMLTKSKLSESNISILEAELIAQMARDNFFANELEKLINESDSSKKIYHAILKNIRANNLTTEDIVQKATGASIDQTIGCDLDINGDIRLGNLTQEGNNDE